MVFRASLNDIRRALHSRREAITSEQQVLHGVLLRIGKKATITVYNNGNVQVQGANKEAIEAMLAAEHATESDTKGGASTSEAQAKQCCEVAYPVHSPTPNAEERPKVFIVHGHDEKRLLELSRLLYQNHYHPIILADEPDCGDTIIEKLERTIRDPNIVAAIVLATPDDKYDNGKKARCRPNVELELGFVLAALTRKKLLILKPSVDKDVEFIVPSDIQGMIYLDVTELETVKHKILRELQEIIARR